MYYYVYILKLANGDYYIGYTNDWERRYDEHLNGEQRATRNLLPCVLVTYVAFTSKTKALAFENYLKTGSGFAFRNRHLI